MAKKTTAELDSEFRPWLKRFGKNLKKIRIDKDIIQDDVENYGPYSISKRLYQRYEAGEVAPTLKALYKISKNLGVSVRELIPDDEG